MNGAHKNGGGGGGGSPPNEKKVDPNRMKWNYKLLGKKAQTDTPEDGQKLFRHELYVRPERSLCEYLLTKVNRPLISSRLSLQLVIRGLTVLVCPKVPNISHDAEKYIHRNIFRPTIFPAEMFFR